MRIVGLWGGKYKLMFRGNDNGIYFNPTPNDTNLEDMETYKKAELMDGEMKGQLIDTVKLIQ